MSKARLIPILAALAFFTAGAAFFDVGEGSGDGLSGLQLIEKVRTGTFADTKEAWRREILALGAEKAYAEFKRANGKETSGIQHSAAHAFGAALYDALGTDGVVVCDGAFAFGCYHEFLGTSIHKEGVGVVSLLDDKCMELSPAAEALGCRHGIGHGILTSLGYSYDDLLAALELCASLQSDEQIGGCHGGIFMEYNMRTLLDDEAKTRKLDAADPHFPCSRLPEQFLPACYFWQPQWWIEHYMWGNEKEDEPLKKVGALCSAAPHQKEADMCYRGVGNNTVGSSRWGVSELKSACADMPTKRGEALCLAGAAGAVAANPLHRDKSRELCADISGKEHDECIRALPPAP